MGTLTITASGFSNLGASAPSNWPSTVTFPASESPDGTKTYTVDDADWLAVLTWIATQQPANSAPTAAQLLLAWLAVWINGTVNAVQQFNTPAPTVPAQITID